MENILKKIVGEKKEQIDRYKKSYSINALLENIKKINSYEDFKSKLIKRSSNNELSIIAEIKKSSPSAGLLVKDFDHLKIAKTYVNNGAQFISVLTEEKYFSGKFDFIKDIKDEYRVPVLCKDFFIDTYQVPLAKSFGADCILIILAALDKILAKDIYQTANDLNISTIVEVHNERESELAMNFDNSIIGINNRNLKNLEVSLDTSVKLSKILEGHKNPLICESGIHESEDIVFILKNTKIKSFLIGESLLCSDDIGSKLREFNKISL